ncbi:MAG TPA: hypothetical protein PK961_02145 [bacterium]|nr:hypothetical protein [bacterium]
MPPFRFFGRINKSFATDGEWVTEIVDPSPNSGIGASIAVDGDGYVHISYYDNGNSSLKYATNRP